MGYKIKKHVRKQRSKRNPESLEDVFVPKVIITVDLVGGVVHAAVVDVVADQLPRDTVGGVPALELGRVVAAGNVLEYNSIKYSSSLTIGE